MSSKMFSLPLLVFLLTLFLASLGQLYCITKSTKDFEYVATRLEHMSIGDYENELTLNDLRKAYDEFTNWPSKIRKKMQKVDRYQLVMKLLKFDKEGPSCWIEGTSHSPLQRVRAITILYKTERLPWFRTSAPTLKVVIGKLDSYAQGEAIELTLPELNVASAEIFLSTDEIKEQIYADPRVLILKKILLPYYLQGHKFDNPTLVDEVEQEYKKNSENLT